MEADLVNPFIEAVFHVLETTASTKSKAIGPYLKKEKAAIGEITCVMDLSGDISGTVSVSFTKKCILGIVSTMFGEEMTEIDDDVKDAAGEFANMISGQVTTKYAELGRSLKVKMSNVHTGENHEIGHIQSKPVIAMPYATENGEFTIEVCFDE